MIDHDLLLDYINRFFGYGSLRSKYWFVGLEEGGADDVATLEKRLRMWETFGRPPVVDLRKFMQPLEGVDWFGPQAPLQRTWRSLIRTRFAAEGEVPDISEVKRYQREELGSQAGETALLEVMPLPVRKRSRTHRWPYADLGLATLSSPENYIDTYEEPRRQRLLQMIADERPAAVVTYGDAAAWRKHLGANEPVNEKAWATRLGTTTIVCTHHPEGARANKHWHEIGQFIRRKAR